MKRDTTGSILTALCKSSRAGGTTSTAIQFCNAICCCQHVNSLSQINLSRLGEAPLTPGSVCTIKWSKSAVASYLANKNTPAARQVRFASSAVSPIDIFVEPHLKIYQNVIGAIKLLLQPVYSLHYDSSRLLLLGKVWHSTEHWICQ